VLFLLNAYEIGFYGKKKTHFDSLRPGVNYNRWIYYFFPYLKRKRRKTRAEEEKITEEIHKGLTEGLAENEQEKSLTSPVEIIRHGWRILYRTVPKEAYMWEWAVELENKTEIPTRVLIKYNLFDENGNMVAEGIGGDELAEKERKIIIGRLFQKTNP
jgi:hypothetical protein